MSEPSVTPSRTSSRIAIGAGAAILALVGAYLTGVIGPSSEPGASPPDTAALQSPADVAPKPENMQETAPQVTVPPSPQIDVFRLQPDGEALIAGQGAPGWSVQILLDGAPHSEAQPGSDGKFASFLTLPHATAPRLLSLRMRHADGQTQIGGTQQIVVAPPPAQPPAAPNMPEATAYAPPPPPDVSGDGAPGAVQTDAAPAVGAPPELVLMADADGARVLQSPAPAAAPRVLSNVALDTISYSDDGAVQLAGRAAGEGSVRIYLDNRPITLSRIAADGTWRTALPQVDTGVYTLRIDELTAQGTVTSRVETPFKREDRTLLARLQNSAAADPPQAGSAPAVIRMMTVQPGNTLWAISRETYGEGMLYVRVFEANADRIRDPDLIYPGQVFTLPD
ncbi:LysM peptidoglycan-binding domain-containing protein [Roseovarius dicentrarchi]|uniref:LysM peptidoglycan-binding domain-containing protein n=1 Tax=Roseovarius dicentrarchi TaxID=2250573 RepID=UPI000DEA2243|nr:LysM peptidoglycan-binding domain-containing protein [Roseovarius dicentrarchi]